MPRASAGTLLRHIHQLVGPRPDDRTDRELLQSFLASRDEAAFAALLQRHGPLVWAVCRRALRHEQDAEDAFQAAFVVLAKKAASIRNTETVGCWLHGVARRTAMNAKKTRTRQRRHDLLAADRAADQPVAAAALRELQELLDEEVERLPRKLRTPFVLCCLEGRSKAEAARELGWKEGTVSSRLAQARERLRQRLIDRGVTLSAALTAGVLCDQSASAGVPTALVQPTMKTALLVAAGESVSQIVAPAVAALVENGVRAMSATKLKIATALLLAMSLIGGVGWAVGSRPHEKPEQARDQEGAKSQGPRADSNDEPLPPGAVARLGSSQLRHPHFVDWAFAPDRKTLLTVGDLRDLRSWDVTTGKLLATRKLPGGPGAALTLSPDGKLLVGYTDQKFVIWELESGKQLAEWPAPGRRWGYFHLSLDGQTLVALLTDSHVLLWDRKKGQQSQINLPPKDPKNPFGIQQFDSSNHACLSPDGKLLATGVGIQSSLRLWDVATAQEVRRFDCDATISAFSPDGKHLAAASTVLDGQKRGGVLHLWEVATGKEAFRLPLEKDDAFYWAIGFSPDGKTIAWVSTEKVTLRDSMTGKEQLRIPGRQRRVLFSPDGKTLAVQSIHRLRFWDLTTGKERNPRPGHNGEADTIAWSPDGRLIATASWVEGALLWDAATGRQLPFPNSASERWELRSLAFSSDSRTLVSAHYDGSLKFWDVARASKRQTVKLRDPDKPNKDWPEFKSYCFSSDRNRLATFDRDFDPASKEISHLDIWEPGTGKHLKRYTFPLGRSWAWAPDGGAVAFIPGDQLLCIDVGSGQVRFQVPHKHEGPLAFTPDGRLLAAPVKEGDSRALRIWDTATGSVVTTLPTGPVLFVTFSDSRTALTTDAKALRVWDLAAAKELRSYRFPDGCGELGSQTYGQELAQSPDGRRAVTSLADGTLLVWDLSLARRDVTPKPATPKEMGTLWDDLAGKDTAKAYQAMWRLSDASSEAVRFIGQRVKPTTVEDPEKVRRLIADLDDDAFEVRQAAYKALSSLGSPAEPVLREALDRNPSAEARRRIEALLANSTSRTPDPEALRRLRAVQVLEHLATPEARRVLREIASGTAGDRLTREAKAALDRLSRR